MAITQLGKNASKTPRLSAPNPAPISLTARFPFLILILLLVMAWLMAADINDAARLIPSAIAAQVMKSISLESPELDAEVFLVDDATDSLGETLTGGGA